MGNSHQPIRILSYQQVIRVGQPLLPSVGFVGFSGVGLKKKIIRTVKIHFHFGSLRWEDPPLIWATLSAGNLYEVRLYVEDGNSLSLLTCLLSLSLASLFLHWH